MEEKPGFGCPGAHKQVGNLRGSLILIVGGGLPEPVTLPLVDHICETLHDSLVLWSWKAVGYHFVVHLEEDWNQASAQAGWPPVTPSRELTSHAIFRDLRIVNRQWQLNINILHPERHGLAKLDCDADGNNSNTPEHSFS